MSAWFDDLPSCDWCGHGQELVGCPGIVDLDGDWFGGDAGWGDGEPFDAADYIPPPTRPYGPLLDLAASQNSVGRGGDGAV